MFPPKVHLIKSHNNLVSANVGNKRYIVGFFQNHHAKLVKHNIDIMRDIEVKHNNPEDVSTDVNLGLQQMGIVDNVPELVIDVGAELHIPVSKKRETFPPLTLTTESTEEFMMWPFEKYLGIILPIEGEFYEDMRKMTWVFPCQIIEPAIDVEKFRRNLKI